MRTGVNSQVDWQKLLDEQKSSGLSKADFCKKKGIKAEHFYYYASSLTKLKPVEINKSADFIPIQIKTPEQLNEASELNHIRLILKNNIECVLPDKIDTKRIKEIVEVLLQC